MLDVTAANAALLQSYEAAWPALRAAVDANGTSGAHLVRIPAGLAHVAVRVAIVGQETAGWTCADSAEAQRDLYPEDGVVHAKQHTPFWRAGREIADTLNGSDGTPFLWANLVAADVDKKRASPAVRDALHEAAPGLLRAALAAARPHVVLFLTGPSEHYAYETEQQFPGIEYVPVDGYDPRALVQLRHPDLPAASFRSYHPAYLQRSRRWGVVAVIADEARRQLAAS